MRPDVDGRTSILVTPLLPPLFSSITCTLLIARLSRSAHISAWPTNHKSRNGTAFELSRWRPTSASGRHCSAYQVDDSEATRHKRLRTLPAQGVPGGGSSDPPSLASKISIFGFLRCWQFWSLNFRLKDRLRTDTYLPSLDAFSCTNTGPSHTFERLMSALGQA